MKKRLLLLTLAALAGASVIYANDGLPPEPNPDYPAVPFTAAVKSQGKWGAVDENGKVVIPISYDRVAVSLSADASDAAATDQEPDRENLIEVSSGTLRGFYHRDGREIVPLSYENRSVWKEGFLAVQGKDKKISFYKNDGTLISHGAYDQVSDFENRMAIVKKGALYGYINQEGKEIPPIYQEARFFQGGLAAVKEKGKWGVIDTAGQYVVPPTYRDVGAQPSPQGLLAVKGNKNLWGFINGAGDVVIPPTYKAVSPTFSGGYAAVQDENKKWGFVDDLGNEVIAPKFAEVLAPFSEGLAAVKTVDGNGYIRTDGSLAFMADYDLLYPFHDGIAEIRKGETTVTVTERSLPISIGIGIGFGHWLDRGPGPGPRPHHGGPGGPGGHGAPPPPPPRHRAHWGVGIGFPLWSPGYGVYETVPTVSVKRGYIDKTGKVIASPANDQVFPAGKEGILISNDKKYGWVNFKGEYIAHTTYSSLMPIEDDHVLLVRDTNKNWGLLSMADGHEILPLAYKDIKVLGGGFFGYKEQGKWGIADKEGNPITPAVYHAVTKYGEGFLPVKGDKGWIYLYTDGTPAITPADSFTDVTPFYQGRAGVKVKGKWGLIDKEGRFVAAPTYDDVEIL